jgi:hypothetical protein
MNKSSFYSSDRSRISGAAAAIAFALFVLSAVAAIYLFGRLPDWIVILFLAMLWLLGLYILLRSRWQTNGRK